MGSFTNIKVLLIDVGEEHQHRRKFSDRPALDGVYYGVSGLKIPIICSSRCASLNIDEQRKNTSPS